jgi:UDP-N-acetylmuramoylalanine--D-glutamate ligase
MKLERRHVLIVGLGASGEAAARLAHREGAVVAVSDGSDTEAVRNRLTNLRLAVDRAELGRHTEEMFAWADVIVTSPGVPLAQPIFTYAREHGAEIIGEVELAFAFLKAPILGITGTKGKSTTTALAGEILRASGKTVFVGGNLGTPLCEAVDARPAYDIAVVELSSFQLETIRNFHPRVAALLNLAPDHQDRYASFDDYVAAKMQLFSQQTDQDVAVLNGDDPAVDALKANLAARVMIFGPSGSNAFFHGAELVLQADRFQDCINIERFRLPGRHNRDNLAAAALIARLAGAKPGAIADAIEGFAGLPHRLETIGEFGGVIYVNDSKATTPGAVRTSVSALHRPAVLILGGQDKGGDWSTLASVLRGAVTAVIAYGQAGPQIAAAMPAAKVEVVGPLTDALNRAHDVARRGQIVLLSPGCASFDQFDDFAARGEAMRAWGRKQK